MMSAPNDASPEPLPTEPVPPSSAPPPRGPGRGAIVVALGLLGLAWIAGLAASPTIRDWWETRVADRSATSAGDGQWYISQMHPWIIQPEPGQCPICGMDLTPVDPDRFAGEIGIDPIVVQNIGIRVEAADVGPIERSFRTVGTVEVDESRLHDVVQRFGGWIVETPVGARFDPVRAGDPLFTIYSPEVFVAERDFLVVRESATGDPASDRWLDSARRKLVLLGLAEEEIARLEETGFATDTVTVRAPTDGVIWEKHVNPGSEIAPRTVAYRIADLSQVWVEATIYEQQLPFVEVGQEATFEVEYGTTPNLRGRVATIYPVVDNRTREARARFVFENPDRALKPGMYATVRIEDRLPGPFVRVPRRSVIGTGTRNVLFVSLGRGRFEPRDVVLGATDDAGRVAILDGVEAGEIVVTSGQFLLDSESRMREALAQVMRGDLAGDVAPPSSTSADDLVPISDATKVALGDALEVYLSLQDALYQGDEAAALTLAATTRSRFETFIAAGRAADEHFEHHIEAMPALREAVASLAGETLAAVRVTFGDMSVPLREVLLTVGAPTNEDGPWIGMRCGMAEGIRDDGVWMQIGDDPRNPYFGNASGMRSCAADTWSIPSADGSAPGGTAGETATGGHEGQHDHAATPAQDAAPATPDGPPRDPAALLTAYGAVADALYADDLDGARAAAPALATALENSGPVWAGLAGHARAIAAAEELATARPPFGELGVALRDAAAAGLLSVDGWVVHHCGMARGIAEKGIWLQAAGEEIENPYFGVEHGMSACAVGTWRLTATGLEEVDE